MNQQVFFIMLLLGAFSFAPIADAKESQKWNPATSWQKQLPSIKVTENGQTKEYSLVSLIRADGHLCPGSAKAYKALQEGLPLLFDNAMPVKEDFTITYPLAAECTREVFEYFMGLSAAKKYLEGDLDIDRQTIVISRPSTKKQVRITYMPVSDKGAKGGDSILHMTNGSGMTISQQSL